MKLTYLGHVIGDGQVATEEKNIEAAQNWSVPMNVREVRYYRKFVHGFGEISWPLMDLLKKNSVLVWTVNAEASF